MKKYKVVLVKSFLKSYSWNDGLFAVQKMEDGILYLWKIMDGKLSFYEDGTTPNITCSSVNNTDIKETDLFVIH